MSQVRYIPPEPVGATKRRAMTPKRKRDIWLRENGLCSGCGVSWGEGVMTRTISDFLDRPWHVRLRQWWCGRSVNRVRALLSTPEGRKALGVDHG